MLSHVLDLEHEFTKITVLCLVRKTLPAQEQSVRDIQIAGVVAQWQSTYLINVKTWVPSSAP